MDLIAKSDGGGSLIKTWSEGHKLELAEISTTSPLRIKVHNAKKKHYILEQVNLWQLSC